jgi:hypothetical protein
MNTQNTSKWVGWFQGALYSVGGLLVASLTVALGQGGALNGTLPPIAAIVVSGLLSILDDMIKAKTGSTVFGMVRTPSFYSRD